MAKRNKSSAFRSPLEEFTQKALDRAGLKFEYEKDVYLLQPSFTSPHEIIEWKGVKEIKQTKIRKITYTPDFTGEGWVIEVKGHRTNEFNIKWKLFKYLIQKEKPMFICLPRNQKQVIECVNRIICLKDTKKKKRLARSKNTMLPSECQTVS